MGINKTVQKIEARSRAQFGEDMWDYTLTESDGVTKKVVPITRDQHEQIQQKLQQIFAV